MSARVLVGDCREVLKTLPEESVHCVVTSPPYWGLRDYGTSRWDGGDAACDHLNGDPVRQHVDTSGLDGGTDTQLAAARNKTAYRDLCGKCGAQRVEQGIGLEVSLDEWVRQMVAVFREVRRVMRKDGTLWLNIGDAYATNGYEPHDKGASRNAVGPAGVSGWSATDGRGQGAADTVSGSGLKPKQRLMLPARVALALQADGWWLRDEIVWRKPNPMPSSVRDRTCPAHEMLYMLTKSARYHYDIEAIKEPISDVSIARLSQATIEQQQGGAKQDAYEAAGINERGGSRRPNEIVQGLAAKVARSGNKERKDEAGRGRSTAGQAGSVPWEGVTRTKRSVWDVATAPFREAHFATFPPALIEPCILAGCPRGGVVLDPFFGAGTTGLVAERLQRDCIGIELNPEYARMARDRIKGEAPLLADVA